jgi:adenosylcobinamide kinase/adenosylcobinamide-phosphate guanylyltransferase
MTERRRPHPFVFVTGGCRSGKSAYAQRLVESWSARRLFLATAEACDDEMRERIRQHRKARGAGWRVHEMPAAEALTLWESIPSLVREGEALLLDCLTLWASACMQGDKAPVGFQRDCARLLAALWAAPCPVAVVSNEVGMGLAPPSPAGRAFRDMAGMASQRAAALADQAVLMVSGVAVPIKGALPL